MLNITWRQAGCALLSTFLLGLCFISNAARADNDGGFSLGSTRVIYDGSKKEATITVINSAANAPFLAQSWVTEYSQNKAQLAKAPFMVTPPLYRQDQGKNVLRIIRTGGQIPDDRESVFWLNVKAIPAQSKANQGKNALQFAYVMRIKLFYRPASLSGNTEKAAEQLTFSRQGNTLVAKNTTPFYVTFNKLSVGGKEIKDASTLMVPPFGEQRYTVQSGISGNQVSFLALNDFGGLLPERKVSF